MVQNFPGPYELRIEYTTLIGAIPIIHTQRLNLDLTTIPNPGDDFTNINVVTRGGVATPVLSAVVDSWLFLVAGRFEDVTTFGIVELWKYTPLTFDAVFISAYTSVVTNGSDVTNPTVVATQEVYTFRTQEGGIMRLTWLETITAAAQPQTFPTGSATVDAIETFVVSSINWILARDTSYPFASLRFLGGQNEKTFRQRFR